MGVGIVTSFDLRVSRVSRVLGLCAATAWTLAAALPVGAAIRQIKPVVEEGKATLEAVVSGDYVSVHARIARRVPEILATLPNFTAIRAFEESEPTLAASGDQLRGYARDRGFLAELGPDARVMLLAREAVSICDDLAREEAKCPAKYTLTLDGPYPSGSGVTEAGWIGLPQGGLGFVIEAAPADRKKPAEGTRLKLILTVQNRGYERYLRFLGERGRVKRVPVEREVLGGFLVWANGVAKGIEVSR